MTAQENRIVALEQRVNMLEQEQRQSDEATQLPHLEARIGAQERMQIARLLYGLDAEEEASEG